MNPLVSQFISAVLRWALQGAFAYLIAKGVLTEEQGSIMLVGLVGSLVTLAWMLWTKYKDRLKFVTALAAPIGSTERQVEASVKAGDYPSITTHKDEVPR
ncbi:MAG TPA: hypothetical protein VNJ04_12115 [Gemmatimonadaceae bacterium]|nr:hypothetical protein [Gemmatimonadaceae bacterium]